MPAPGAEGAVELQRRMTLPGRAINSSSPVPLPVFHRIGSPACIEAAAKATSPNEPMIRLGVFLGLFAFGSLGD